MKKESLNLISLVGVKFSKKRKTDRRALGLMRFAIRKPVDRVQSNLPGSALRYPSLRNLVGVRLKKRKTAEVLDGRNTFGFRRALLRIQSSVSRSALPLPCLTAAISLVLVVFPAFGRDLVDAASQAQSLLNRIGIAAISIGITSGGILFTIGMAQIGRMVLISGIVGALCVLGAPAIISLLARIFGVSV